MTLPLAISRAATLDLLRALAQTQDVDARELLEGEIITGNLRFCWTTAQQYVGHGVELDDLFAEAQAALLVAMRRFDAARPTAFSGYAARCLRQALLRAIRRQGSPVAIPRTEFVAPGTLSLDHQPETQSESMLGADTDMEATALTRVDGDRLARLVDALPDRESVVVRLRFGLAGCAPHELAEIGMLIGVSKQRAQAILNNGLAKIRTALMRRAA